MISSALSDPGADEGPCIRAQGVGKRYHLWKSPGARLKYSVLSQAHRTIRSFAGADAVALGPIKRARDGLCESFDALRDVSFSIRRGESVAIIGRNGSGKSTLLQILAGTLQPSAGSMATTGRLAAMLELGSGFSPEFSGRENVYLNASVLGFSHAQTAACFADIEKFADIGVFIDQPVKSYSSGMVVRLAFAVLVHIEPEILIIDEALAVGDFLFQQKCFDYLRKFRERRGTFLFVSHSMSTVLDLCGRALFLDRGQLAFDGPSKEAVDLYEGSALQQRYDESGPALRMQQASTPAPAPSESDAPSSASQQALNDAEEAMLAEPELAEPEVGSLVSDSVQLRYVRLAGADGTPREWITSEEEVSLAIGILCHTPLYDPHIGFKIRDRLGRVMFETSSLCMGQHIGDVGAGELLVSRFRFQLPLHAGQYSITVGFANGATGTSDYHEALLFQHGAKTFEVVRNRDAIIWSGVFNLRPQFTFSRQLTEPRAAVAEGV